MRNLSLRALFCVWTAAFLSTSAGLSQTSVTTYHNDIGRTGQNLQETILTPANVNASGFGQLFTIPVDAQVYAQPLYLPSLTVGGSQYNVLFVATENDSVYAFDADRGGLPLWQVTMTDAAHGAAAGATSVPPLSNCSIGGNYIGITGTPVIDPATNTLYLVSATQENGYPVQRLHALDVTTGAEKFGGPTTITATVAGTGSGSTGGSLSFDPAWEFQRPGLLLLNGTVYIGWGASCDLGPWHGWIMGYSASTLQQTSVFPLTPNGSGGGVWMAGAGLSADTNGPSGAGRMFVATGNGDYTATPPYATGTVDYGDSILNLDLSSGLQVTDEFTPYNQALLDSQDSDLGSGSALVLPDQPGPYPHLLINLGKGQAAFNSTVGGVIYVLNRDNLGGYNTSSDNVLQRLPVANGALGAPAYWNGNVYFWAGGGVPLWQYSLTNGVLSSSPVAVGSDTPPVAEKAGNPVISANGNTNAIVWTIDSSAPQGILRAYDATNVATTLYSSATNAKRDALPGPSVSFSVPTVVNGKVYVGTNHWLTAYGLLTASGFSLSPSPASVTLAPGGTVTSTITVASQGGFSGTVAFSASGLPSGVTASFAPASSVTSTILTLTASASAAIGSAVVTVTGTSGSLTHTATVNLSVNSAPDFSLTAAPSNLTIQQSSSATSTITVVPSSGFAGTVAFSASGLPSGVTASFSPLSSTGATTLSLTASATAASGTSIVTITGTSGSLTHTTSVALTVAGTPDFGLTAAPASVSVAPGSSANSTVTVSPLNGFSGVVAFSATGLPTGVTATFSPASSASATTLTFNAANSAVSGTSTVTVTGVSGSLTHTATLTVAVTAAPNFALTASPSSLSIASGASGSSTISVVPANGFTGSVNFSASGLPAGVTASFSPASSASATTLILAAATSALSGTSTVTVTGVSGSLTHTATVTLAVTAAQNFALTASPSSLSIASGASGSSTINVVPANGFAGSVNFSASGLPSGVTAAFSPTSSTTSSKLTLTASSRAAGGTFTVTVTGTSGQLAHSANLSVTINGSTPIVPYVQVNGASWQQTSSVTVPYGAVVNLGPQPLTGGTWSWTGPRGYSSNARQINRIPLAQGTNTFVATFTNSKGVKTTQTFTITETQFRR